MSRKDEQMALMAMMAPGAGPGGRDGGVTRIGDDGRGRRPSREQKVEHDEAPDAAVTLVLDGETAAAEVDDAHDAHEPEPDDVPSDDRASVRESAPVHAAVPAPRPPQPPAMPTTRQREAVRALQQGNVVGFVEALAGFSLDKFDATARDAVLQVAEFAKAQRRENIVTLGDHQVFVRKTSEGTIKSTVRPVRLTIAGKHLYEQIEWSAEAKKRVNTNPGHASLTADGYFAIASAAGVQIRPHERVWFNGEYHPNPYVRYREDAGTGDVDLIVVGIDVVGCNPMTGDPAVVRYTLEYTPISDLQMTIGKLATKQGQDHTSYAVYPTKGAIVPIPSVNWPRFVARLESTAGANPESWIFVPMAGGMGYAADLSDEAVMAAFNDYTKKARFAMRHAMTVAKRNAMREHPAFAGVKAVKLDPDGGATIPVIAWKGDDSDVLAWERILKRLAENKPIDGVSVVTRDARYESNEDDVLDADDLAPSDDGDGATASTAESRGWGEPEAAATTAPATTPKPSPTPSRTAESKPSPDPRAQPAAVKADTAAAATTPATITPPGHYTPRFPLTSAARRALFCEVDALITDGSTTDRLRPSEVPDLTMLDDRGLWEARVRLREILRK